MSDQAADASDDPGEHDHEHLTLQNVDRAAVGHVSRFVELQEVRVATQTALLSPRYALDEPLPTSWLDQVKLGWIPQLVARLPEDDPSTFRVLPTFYAHFDHEWLDTDEEITHPPEGRDPDLVIEARFVLQYTLSEPDEVTEDQLTHFAVFNGTFNAWPYWREYAQQASLRLGLTPPLIVPVLRVPKLS